MNLKTKVHFTNRRLRASVFSKLLFTGFVILQFLYIVQSEIKTHFWHFTDHAWLLLNVSKFNLGLDACDTSRWIFCWQQETSVQQDAETNIFRDFDGCTSVHPTAPAAAAVDHQQQHYHHKRRQLQWRSSVPLPTAFGLVFSPSVCKSAPYPAWKWPPDPDAAMSPTAYNFYAVWREQLKSRPKQTRSTAQCSVWLNVMRQQRYRTTKLKLTFKWLKFAAERNMMQADTAGAQVSIRKLPRSQLSATEGRVLSDFVATWINI